MARLRKYRGRLPPDFTNVLLYLLSADAGKADTVEHLLEAPGSIASSSTTD